MSFSPDPDKDYKSRIEQELDEPIELPVVCGCGNCACGGED